MIKKHPLEIYYTELKIGQKLYDITYGDVTVEKISLDGLFPIKAIDTRGINRTYTNSGGFTIDNIYPHLYLSNPFEYKPISEYPKVMHVKNHIDHSGSIRVIIAKINGQYISAGAAIQSLEDLVSEKAVIPHSWKYATDIEPEPVISEYTIEEIAKLLCKDPKEIRIIANKK